MRVGALEGPTLILGELLGDWLPEGGDCPMTDEAARNKATRIKKTYFITPKS